MLFVPFVVILYTLLTSVHCNVQIIEATPPRYSDIDFDKTGMLSSASPYVTEEECTPARAWLLTRHGIKYPPEDALENINTKLVPIIQKAISDLYANEDEKNFTELLPNQKHIIRKLKNWKNVFVGVRPKDLSEPGKSQMTELGKRWNAKLKKLTKTLRVNEIEVLSAEEDRCVLSGKKFIHAFFEGDYDEIEIPRNLDGDSRLKLQKPAEYKVKVDDPDNAGETMDVEDLYFRQNCPPITKRIQKLLFPDHIKDYQMYRDQVSDDMVKTMYHACTYGYHYSDEDGIKTDAWCWLFRYKDLKMFENRYDLRYYYKNGYYLNDNIKVGNPITEDLLQFLTNSKGLRFKLFVGHTSNILSMITRFNLFRDDVKLTVDNIEHMENRKWKTSFITPLGSNIMVVVYDCGYKTLKVSFYFNETPIQMVTDDGKPCTKCPIEDVRHLIIGFNTSEMRHSQSDLDLKTEKIKKREEKLRDQKLKREEQMMRVVDEQESERWNNALDDKEEYWDKNEQP